MTGRAKSNMKNTNSAIQIKKLRANRGCRKSLSYRTASGAMRKESMHGEREREMRELFTHR